MHVEYYLLTRMQAFSMLQEMGLINKLERLNRTAYFNLEFIKYILISALWKG